MMIQRIQTLYLLIIAALMAVTLFSGLAWFAGDAGEYGLYAVYYFLSWRVFSDLTFHTQGFKPAIVLPLVCLLFAYLAARAIFRDELLVRAADRIR